MNSQPDYHKIKKQVCQCYEHTTGSKLKPVKMPKHGFRDLYSLDNNTLVILKYSKFLPDKEYPYFFGISKRIVIWVPKEWPRAQIWLILDDAKHVAILDAHELGRSLLQSKSASCDSRDEFKLLVTDDYKLRLDSGNQLICLSNSMHDYGLPCEHERQDVREIRTTKIGVLPKYEQERIASYWEDVMKKVGLQQIR